MSARGERDQVLRESDALWERLRARLDMRLELPLDPADPEGWTGKDVYAHLARWQAISIASARSLIAGAVPETEPKDEDVLNERWRLEDRILNAAEARARCLASRAELRALIAGLDADQWQSFGRLFDDITGPHYLEHLRAAGDDAA